MCKEREKEKHEIKLCSRTTLEYQEIENEQKTNETADKSKSKEKRLILISSTKNLHFFDGISKMFSAIELSKILNIWRYVVTLDTLDVYLVLDIMGVFI